jgi:hypothetical protein
MRRAVVALVVAVTLTGCSAEGWIAAFWPDNYQEARSVAWCESRLDPNAVSPGGANHGTFQINVVHRASFEQVMGQPFNPGIYDPAANAMFARWLYDQSGGWGPWSCRPR